MNNNTYIIKELKINDSPDTGVQAVSFVDLPAIEEQFELFAKEKTQYWKWTSSPDQEIIDTSHKFCKMHAYTSKDRIYTTEQVKSWSSFDQKEYAFIAEGANFMNFDGTKDFMGDQYIYNCRHRLQKVSQNDIPKTKLNQEISNQINFAIESIEKQEVVGCVLKSGQLIYRNNADSQGNSGYVWFSRQTIRDIKEKYGYNRNITYMHEKNVTGNAVLLDSWLEEDDTTTKWMLRYKIVGPTLWEHIKARKVMGFSIESIFVL